MAMALISMDGVIEYINTKAIKVLGFQHEDIPTLEQWWVKAYPDEAYRRIVIDDWTERVHKAIVEQTEIFGNEYQITCKDNSIKTCFIYGVPVASKVFVMSEDITERKRIEVSLRKSEERFRNIIETSQEWIWAIDKYGNHIYSNPAIRTTLGYEPSDFIGKDSLSFMHEDDSQVIRQKLPVYLAQKKGWSGLILRWRFTSGVKQ